MQIKCRYCTRPFSMERDEVVAALESLHTDKLNYYSAHCPHCGKVNKISKIDLRRGAPAGTKKQPETTPSTD